MILSILTPAVPTRLDKLAALCAKLHAQIDDRPVEHLALLDNKRRTVGEKRDALLRAARGEYVAFVDDDDDVSDDYVTSLLQAFEATPDVVTFKQHVSLDGFTGICTFELGNPNEAPAPHFKRNAWHVCAWRRRLAILSSFPATSYGEDWAYAAPLCALARGSVHLDKVLHFYRYDTRLSEAPPP